MTRYSSIPQNRCKIFEFAGLSLSRLPLTVGAPVLPLQNLDQSNGLTLDNGLLRIIPRIAPTSLEADLAFTLTRRQLPMRVLFCYVARTVVADGWTWVSPAKASVHAWAVV